MHRRDFLVSGLVAGGLTPLLTGQAAGTGQQNAPEKVRDVQLLVFDTFGTVVDWRSAVIAEGEKLGKEKGLKVDWAAFADAWRGGYGPSMNRVRRGELPWTKLDALHRMVLDGLLVKFKIDGLSEAEKQNFNKVWHRLRGWPDAVAGLTRLKKRYVIAPLSNGNVSLLTDMAKFAGLPWDAILSTELVRHYKPDKETYLMPGEFWDLPPASVMMVAAHGGDLDAAKALGLRTAYVHRPLENGASRPSTMPDAGKYDFQIKDFKELATQLGL
jgi:2-haloacid dehalogenase